MSYVEIQAENCNFCNSPVPNYGISQNVIPKLGFTAKQL